jgi:hypothetical protein
MKPAIKVTVLFIVHMLLQSALYILMSIDRHLWSAETLIEKLPRWAILLGIALFAFLFIPQLRKSLSRIAASFTWLGLLMLLVMAGTFHAFGLTSTSYLSQHSLYDQWQLLMGYNGQSTDMYTCIHPVIWLAFSICLFSTFVRFTLPENAPVKISQWIFRLLPLALSLSILVYLMVVDRPEFAG